MNAITRLSIIVLPLVLVTGCASTVNADKLSHDRQDVSIARTSEGLRFCPTQFVKGQECNWHFTGQNGKSLAGWQSAKSYVEWRIGRSLDITPFVNDSEKGKVTLTFTRANQLIPETIVLTPN